MFDLEYARWLEEHHRIVCELRAALQEHLPENELRLFVDNCLAHYDQVMNLKSIVAKTDVFHLVSGMWKTPAERCFLWIGGFRPSELIKVPYNWTPQPQNLLSMLISHSVFIWWQQDDKKTNYRRYYKIIHTPMLINQILRLTRIWNDILLIVFITSLNTS